MITATSLTHPTMIKKIRAAMKEAITADQGRAYVENSKGHNVLRCSYFKDSKRFAFWASGHGCTEVTPLVKAAFEANREV